LAAFDINSDIIPLLRVSETSDSDLEQGVEKERKGKRRDVSRRRRDVLCS